MKLCLSIVLSMLVVSTWSASITSTLPGPPSSVSRRWWSDPRRDGNGIKKIGNSASQGLVVPVSIWEPLGVITALLSVLWPLLFVLADESGSKEFERTHFLEGISEAREEIIDFEKKLRHFAELHGSNDHLEPGATHGTTKPSSPVADEELNELAIELSEELQNEFAWSIDFIHHSAEWLMIRAEDAKKKSELKEVIDGTQKIMILIDSLYYEGFE